MKRYIDILENDVEHDEAALGKFAALGLKPAKRTAWLFLSDAESPGSDKATPVMRIDSPQHARRVYEMLTRVTLRQYADDPTIGMFSGLSGRALAKIVLDVFKAMNVPESEYTVA